MSKPPMFRARGRTFVLVPTARIEAWSEHAARARLEHAAREWPTRDDLLRLSDATFGPADDLSRALEHLVAAFDRGRLVAVRMPDDAPAGAGPRRPGADWDDIPRLSDLLHVDGGDAAAAEPDRAPARPDPSADDPRAPGTAPTDPGADTPTDTWTSFVAFAVVDQHGNPLRGDSHCTVDGSDHAHALADAPIDIRPIPTLARVRLTLDSLTLPDASAGDPR